ncbi:hypothetical protein Glove_113g16 [Diversispora epigaea]|uniref:Zinc-ribbon domain-containing protein n=1 Tax=Diversispora epigaea TaxID=1348612 RepID=A0A397JAF4_9GLOM|nr:hypothetical protein Glove_113g16 [Diversispora epigaea]
MLFPSRCCRFSFTLTERCQSWVKGLRINDDTFNNSITSLIGMSSNEAVKRALKGKKIISKLAVKHQRPIGFNEPLIPNYTEIDDTKFSLKMRRKLTLIDAQNIALEKDGQCLSEFYINNKSPLRWKCAKFHEWNASLCNIKRGTWCPQCARCSKLNIDIAKEIALKKGGICLSVKYINTYTPLFWQCAKKHEWQAPLERIRNHNSWCPKCVIDTRRVGLDLAKNIAQSRNGKCLSDEYINNHTPLQWKCGKCLSEKYIDINSSLLWECNEGHQWYTNLKCVRNLDTWCPHCSGNAKLSIEEARKIATKNKGLCLSETYNGTWCPFCPWKRQELCKEIITKLLGPPSDIRRPDFLKTPDHPLGLELDIYYPQYGFAVEVQGIQHECFHAFFHKNQKDFEKQFARDQLKKELCNKNRILLIEVWYYEDPYLVIPRRLKELGLIS